MRLVRIPAVWPLSPRLRSVEILPGTGGGRLLGNRNLPSWERGILRAALVVLVVATLSVSCSDSTPTSDAFSEWTLVQPGNDGALWDVTVGGPGFVAVGVGGSESVDGVVWSSTDGLEWVRAPGDEAAFGGEGEQWITNVAAGESGLVAVGSEHTDDHDAAVWASTDGSTWVRVPHDEVTFGGDGDQEMADVAAGGPGFVAVGSDGDLPAVWTSPDGFTWSRLPNQLVFDTNREAAMRGVVATESGLVAVGEDGAHAAVWTSLDGTTWSRVPHQDDVFCSDHVCSMAAVAVGDEGLVAVGHDAPDLEGLAAGIWTSPDGDVWTRHHLDSQPVRDITRAGTSFVAISKEAGFDGDPVVWISPDGVDWSRAADNSGAFRGEEFQAMWSIAASDTRVVAVGVKHGISAIWTTELHN